MSSYFRFQLNRKSRKYKHKFRSWRRWALNYTDRHIFGGWEKFSQSRWVFISLLLVFVVSMFGLWQQLLAQNDRYLGIAAEYGGTYAEALSGQVKGVNPLYPDNSATTDVTAVVFSGLTRVNSDRKIEPDLASSWEVSADKKTYTFKLRPNLKWHDGEKLDANDVAFTISRIQNPDSRSPLSSNWSGVNYEVLNDLTIKFSLPNSYSPFLYNTTVGIIPKHILEGVRPSLTKTFEFNQKPVGSGPYKLPEIVEKSDEINLVAYDEYHFRRPYIDKLKFVQYTSENDYLDGYQKKQISGFAISDPDIEKKASQIDQLKINHLSLPAYGALFFNMNSPNVSDVNFRKALTYATDKNSIVKNQLDSQAIVVNYPILAGYSGFDSTAPKYSYDEAQAKSIISSIDQEKIKNTRIRLATLRNSVYEDIALSVKEMWAKVGVQVDIASVDLDELQQYYIRTRNYDVLLYGQDIGYDSDIYAYWHSSQAKDPGLNISQYVNPEADKYLETGRLAKDTDYKNSRYSAFLQTWSKDLPAIILYTPYYNYAQSIEVKGFSANKIVEPSNRFYNIQDWYVLTKQAPKTNSN
ncbi:MAG: transporter substrate-binding protein [Patescibacteria group bacterium]|nr:transporter substrate-binding protein [Patescibacteria group bacterium]